MLLEEPPCTTGIFMGSPNGQSNSKHEDKSLWLAQEELENLVKGKGEFTAGLSAC